MFCVVGLGNPGREYSRTRHNLGFRVVDRLAESLGTRIRRREYSALTARVSIGRSEVLIIKPQTYMNRSGTSVRAAVRALGLPIESLLVVYDDVDLPLGRIRVRAGGGTAGHNGVASVSEACGSPAFVRIRLGVGRPPAGADTADYVLTRFARDELPSVERAVERAAEAVRSVIEKGVEPTMAEFNAPEPDGAPG